MLYERLVLFCCPTHFSPALPASGIQYIIKMTTEDFVKKFYLERKALVNLYFEKSTKTDISELINELQLDVEKTERLKQILNEVLRDAYYTSLLGLDGSTSIGNSNQETFKIFDEQDNLISDCGELEVEAYEYFHNNKFELDNTEADFIATLTYHTPEQGGRKTPAKSGYRPQVKFDFDEMQTSGEQKFIDRELVFPGDVVEAEITIISVDYFANKLREGMSFEFREGGITIGVGNIKHIKNDKLRQASR